nr:DNA polymerase I [Deinococcus maricopensis]
MTAPDTVVLIDGHALAYRSYFAIPPLTNSAGESTNAILGFLRLTLRLEKQVSNQVIVVFDPPVKTFRHEQFEGYKAGRAQTPEDLPKQINRIRSLVDAMGLPRLEVPGYEADDVIGTLAKRAEAQGLNVRIVTSDRDAYQLLSERVKVLTSDFKLLGPDEVLEKYGVTVGQWVDYRALTGDASDNIPGAKGIGPKTAAKLLQEHGSLDAVLQAAEAGALKPKGTQEKIAASVQDVLFSRELSCMVTDLPLDVELGALRGHGDRDAALAILRELELNSLLKDVDALMSAQAAGDVASAPATLALGAPATEAWTTPTEDAAWGYRLSREDELSAHLLDAATFGAEVARVAPHASAEEGATPSVDLSAFEGVRVVNAVNAKALATHLQVRGVSVEPGEDPLLIAYLLDNTVTNASLLAQAHLGAPWPDDAPTRALATAQLLTALRPQLDEKRAQLYKDVERPLAHVLARMEVRGVRLDSAYLRGLSDSLGARAQELDARIQELAGHPFSVNSRDQLESVLYDELGLASGKKTKLTGKRSTAVSALEPLRDEHPIIPLLLEYRELTKLKGTYLDPLPNLVNPLTGRLHTTFAQTAVATGRLSSLNPNLQNIPIRSETGREIRKGFIADDGFCLISADYSQIELRLLAHIADDALMQEAFVGGADIHRRTAAQVLGVMEDLVTPNQRRAAKTVNFGVLYGMSAHRLSNDLGISFAEASRFIERYFATYPRIREYIDATLAFGREHGYVETMYGRRRLVPELRSANRTMREAGERVAYNMPIQGTAADIIKIAMVELDEQLSALGARLLLQVHDELLIEAPSDRADEVAALTRRVMEGVVTLKVPLRVEIGTGPNWYDTK